MIKLAALAATVALLSAGAAEATEPAPQIIGGEPADRQYSFIAEVQWRKPFPGAEFGHHCGGTLLAPRWVLTAAHCVSFGAEVPPLSDLRIRVGSVNRSSGGALVGLSRIVVHPSWSESFTNGDIALVELSEPVHFLPALVAPRSPEGRQIRLLGWGMTCAEEECFGQYPETLRQLDTWVVDDGACEPPPRPPSPRPVPPPVGIDPVTELCVSRPDGAGDCAGDSGGPALLPLGAWFLLVGVDSRGTTAACGGAPTIYTDATAYREWIYRTIATGA